MNSIIANSIFLKNSSYVGVILITAAFFEVTPISVFVLAVLIVVDVITGIIKSGSIYGWQGIQSKVLQRGVIAKLLLITVPFVVAFIGKGVGISLSYIAQSAINLLILSEGYSIIGNIYAVRTGIDKEEFDAVAYVLRGIKNLLRKAIFEDKQNGK